MPTFTDTRLVEPAEADRLLAARRDIVVEAPDGSDATPGGGRAVRMVLDQGPFAHYRRTAVTSPAGVDGAGSEHPAEVDGAGSEHPAGVDGAGSEHPAGGDLVSITQTFDYRLPPGTWPFLMNWPVRAALRRPPRRGTLPWWYPPQRPDAQAATVLGLLATLSLIVGYHGTLLTQTMTFAADEFGAGTAAQGDALAAVRAGGVIAIALGTVADRRGRRIVLTLALLGCIASTVAGALAPSLAALAVSQAVNRGAWAAASLLLAVIAAEEMPAGARAYALSLLSMTGALGAGVALWLLPVADLSTGSWRLLYLFPVLFVPVVVHFGRLVPESRRFVRPHGTVGLAGHWWRLLLVAGSALLVNIFMAPQSQFRNEFLRDERSMSAALITLFVLVTSTPAGIGIFAGGRLADTRGRRVVAATGITVGTLLITASFIAEGPAMWAAALLGGMFAAALVPTITVYGPELFPTSLRGRANGIVSTTAMAGSVLGLAAFGRLQEAAGSFGRALSLLAVAPLAMAVVVLAFFPETARRELEDLNPEDRAPEDRAPEDRAPEDRAPEDRAPTGPGPGDERAPAAHGAGGAGEAGDGPR